MHSGEGMPYNKEILFPESDVYSLALLLLEVRPTMILFHISAGAAGSLLSFVFRACSVVAPYWKEAILTGTSTVLHSVCRHNPPNDWPPPVSGQVSHDRTRHRIRMAYPSGVLVN